MSFLHSNAMDTLAEEYLLQYAMIIAINNNVCPVVFYKISRLSKEFYNITARSLEKFRVIYFKYAPSVKLAYQRSLLNRHIEYTNTCVRTIPVPNMMGMGGGIRFLDTDPPLFTRDFIRDRIPALTNICILTNHPVEFYYRIGIQEFGTITSGRIIASDYVALPPRTRADGMVGDGRNNERGVDPDVEIENIHRPGRYFLDLNLILSVNPLLLHELICRPEILIMNVSRTLIWYDSGDMLEPILRPDIRVIMNHFTHFIAQFKTVPSAFVDPLHMRLNIAGIKNPKKFPLITDDRRVRPVAIESESEEEPNYLLTADDLLGNDFADPDDTADITTDHTDLTLTYDHSEDSISE